jgi:hypothetical protein
MAKKEPFTSTAESTFIIPPIVVPADARIDEDGIGFDLEVGCNKVSFRWWRSREIWHFDGNQSDALLELGLLRPEWMPGFPGNNISAQTVLFGEDVPRVIRGNMRGGRKGISWLRIVRKSCKGVMVQYAPPLEHRPQLNSLVDEVRARLQSEAKSPPAVACNNPQSPSEPSLSTARFSERLKTALEFRGFDTLESQVAHIVATTGRSPQTARRWLAGWEPIRFPRWLLGLCDSLKVRPGWVLVGEGPDPMEMALIESVRAMTEWEKGRFFRFGIRLLNKDSKAIRLGEMFDRGQISRQQLFSMM